MVTQLNSPAVNVLEVTDDLRFFREVKAFLKELNSAGVAFEALDPRAARQIFADAQASVTVDLFGSFFRHERV